MRREFCLLTAVVALAAAGCNQRPGQSVAKSLATYDISEPEPGKNAGPQIAYTYSTTYRLRSTDIASIQDRQLGACRALGPQRCLVLKSSISGGGDGDAIGEASIIVDARLAGAFSRKLDAVAAAADGTVADRSVTAEDVTKQVIDTDASVRAKEALSARLLTLIQTAHGNVGELVSAEKAYADTQQDLTSARALQAELQRRVAMSQIDITYSGLEATGTFAPVRLAVTSAGTTLAESLRVLITAAVALLPWILVLLALRWIGRRLGWRGPLARIRDWRARRAPAD